MELNPGVIEASLAQHTGDLMRGGNPLTPEIPIAAGTIADLANNAMQQSQNRGRG